MYGLILNKEQRRPFVLRSVSQISCVLHHQLNGKILRAICAGPVL